MTRRRSKQPTTTDQVVSAVLTASRALVAVSARSLADVEDRLTITQFRTLVVLESEVGANLNRLAERLGVTPSTALRSVDRLVNSDLVSRQENPDNRREVMLSLTPEGLRVVRDVTANRRREIARILRRMPDRERDELVSVFAAFAHAAEEPNIPAAAPSSLGW